jgi:hypothetical protein
VINRATVAGWCSTAPIDSEERAVQKKQIRRQPRRSARHRRLSSRAEPMSAPSDQPAPGHGADEVLDRIDQTLASYNQ